MNETQAPLRLERVRSFSRVFSDTRRFIRENFGIFFRTILFLVGPVAILTCTLDTIYQMNLGSPVEDAALGRFGSYLAMTQIYWQLRWAINGFVTAIVVSHLFKVYREKGRGNFDVSDVTKSIFRDFFGNALAFIVMFLAVAAVAVLLGYMMYGLMQVSVTGAFVMIVAGWIAYILIRFPFWYFIYSVFIARTSKPKTINVFPAMGFAGKVLSGSWWNSWVIFFCMWLLLYLMGLMVTLLAELAGNLMSLVNYQYVNDPNWKIIVIALNSIGEFAKTVINSVFCVTVAIHFYGLKEKLDGEGTRQVVEMIGTKQDDDEANYTY